jgi:hypothetical protein
VLRDRRDETDPIGAKNRDQSNRRHVFPPKPR